MGLHAAFGLKCQSVLESKLKQAMGAAQLKLRADVGAMFFDGEETNAKLISNFLAGLVLGDEFQNATLTRRQRLKAWFFI